MMLIIRIVLFAILHTYIVEPRSGITLHTSKGPCDNYYCAHGGTCVSQSHNINIRCRQPTPTCQCTGSWQGDRCDDNPCAGINCNSGTCRADETGSPSCCCPEGCKGDTCADDDNRSCEAANGQCVTDDGNCASDRILDIPCCNGKVCCHNNQCDAFNCNTGICYTDNTGSPSCFCPEGCTGERCEEDDNSSCEAANGVCIINDGTCASDRILDIPCCNGKVCCQSNPCDDVNCNGGTCFAADNVLTLCLCPDGTTGETCSDVDDCIVNGGVC